MSKPETDLTNFARHARIIAGIAAGIAMSHFRNPLSIEFKSDESPVTQADKAVEQAVRDYLAEHFPDHGILGEEQGADGIDKADLWVTDPIDGTRTFLSGHPLFGFLLAYLERGMAQVGLVGMPALGETYLGIAGKGATLNGAPISVSRTTAPDRAILYVNEGDKIHQHCPQVFQRLMQTGQTRRFAYDCYPHALLAAGFVDAVVDYDLHPYDFLPISALVDAAGGIMTDWNGNPITRDSDGRILSAATPELHRELLSILNPEQ